MKRWIWIGAALALLGAALIPSARVRWQLADYKKLLAARGVKLAVAELHPPPVAPEENVGSYLWVLAGQLNSQSGWANEFMAGMRLVGPGRARVAWQQPQPLESGAKTNLTWEEAAASLAADRETLAQIHEMLTRPHLDLHLNYSQGFSLLLPHLAPHKSLVQYLARSVLIRLRQGDLPQAGRDLHDLLALVRVQSEEPLVISQLVQLAMTHIALAATWEALQAPGWSESDLAQLQQDWESLRFISPMKQALAMERAVVIQYFGRARHSLRELDHSASAGSSDAAGAVQTPRLIAWQAYFSYPDELHFLKFHEAMQRSLEVIGHGAPFAPALKQWEETTQRLGDETGLAYLVSRRLLPNLLGNLLAKEALAETTRQMATTAIALQRYRLKHGQAAGSLSFLSPEFLSTPPTDPLDGKTLRYQPNAEGSFRLYSVGTDGQDDGGNARPATTTPSHHFAIFTGKDWLWPLPATPAEVAAARNRRGAK